uniref:Structural protein n=1 Tax=Panagrellus redivivus TaxID=6233 RepID=A0A7E4URP4_PANRE
MSFETSVDKLKAIGKPVEIDIKPINSRKSSDTSVSGNIVAFDPETDSVGLVQFDTSGKPAHLVYIPGTSIQEIHDLSDGPFDPKFNYVAYSDEIKTLCDTVFGVKTATTNFTPEEVAVRKEKLLTLFNNSNLEYTVTDGGQTITVGGVRIKAPYGPDDFYSENTTILGRMKQLALTAGL